MTAMHNVTEHRVRSSATHRPVLLQDVLYDTDLSVSLGLFIADTKKAILCHLEKSLWPVYESYVLLVFSQARKFPLIVNLASHQEGY